MSGLEGGRSVGRYRILDFLGAGAMGEVYLAEDPHIERKLAIKTVRLAGRPQELEDRKKRLLREARAAGRLLHPNVVALFDAGEADGLLYLAFEFVEGSDLANRLERGPLSLREVLRIVRQVADALHYAHGQGIVHRDIKPSNILIDTIGRVKVADFGIAKMAGQSTELTVAGSVMGSPQYLSPEQIRGEELDGRSDVFSLGVVLYELLSGNRPFAGETITTLVYQILHKEPPPVSALRAVPPRVEELLRRMLAKDRDERMATAAEVAKELAAIEAELSDETLSAPAGSDELERTFALPRRTSTVSPGTVVPPPPPPASLPTGPSTPRTATLTQVPPLPQVPPPPPQQPPQAMPAPAAAAAPPARKSVLPWLLAAAGLVLLVALAAGWGIWSIWQSRVKAAQQTAETATETGMGSDLVTDLTEPSPEEEISPEPASHQDFQPTKQSPAQTHLPADQPTDLSRPPEPRPQPPVPPPSVTRETRPSPNPIDTRPAPVPERPAPSAPEPEEEEEEAEPERPAVTGDVDQTIRTGLQVTFRVTPPDAYVVVDRAVLGMAKDWSGQKGARTYTFPGPGTYLVKIRKDGMKEHRIAVEVSGAGVVTPINVRMRSVAAAEVETSDLERIQVREAVAFRVEPADAVVSVDGQEMGSARQYSGGMGRKGWLTLSPGRHRVSITAPGFRRQDYLVDVTGGAEEEKQRINVRLAPGGDE
ncbi:MAG TPA: serine/threonine-protein kinase [Thermoanaerobaculia bacterium]|nr:serine/threonine-protein kinase [Thermoanaerobaculia bacterium]